MSRQKMKRREQKTVVTVYFMLRHFKLMSQYRTRMKDKKFCRDQEIYVATEFRVAKNDKLVCNKVSMSRHKTLMS